MTKLSKEAEELLATGQNQIIKDQSCQKRLRVIAELLGEKLTLVKSLDDEINTKCEVADTENEIEESDIINSRVMKCEEPFWKRPVNGCVRTTRNLYLITTTCQL